jgi:hypothetical protein
MDPLAPVIATANLFIMGVEDTMREALVTVPLH